jgi:glycerol uptake facilitator protein
MTVMATQSSRRLLAELIGTALLLLFGPGSVVAALKMGAGKADRPGLDMIAPAFGLVIAIVIYGFGTTSGARIDPAVNVSGCGEVPAEAPPRYAG